MKLRNLAATSVGLFLFGSLLYANEPVLTTPGTASWIDQTTATGTRTVFTLTGNTVLNWNQLNLASGSELVFDFTSGRTVVNFLGGTRPHVIDGTVTSNGIVAFFSPTADLQVNGSIIAKGVTLATLTTNANHFSSNNGYELTDSGGTQILSIDGHVQATDGDVVLGGEGILIGGTGRIQATRDVLIGASKNFSVAPSGDRRITEKSGEGFVLHLGTALASRIEIAAGSEIYNQGILDPGAGKIFLRVGQDGLITSEKSGVYVKDAEFEGNHNSAGSVLVPDEGDALAAISEGTLNLPALRRPNGDKVSVAGAESGKPITYSVPMSASGDAGRDVSGNRPDKKQIAKLETSKSLLQRTSFFGMRGGSAPTAKR